ncbi:MAG TPA: hypothetical protein VMB34_01600 [Acetobacteraceae bacterium]|nr:hypothetical protein [Acetobacteraceae bacterium]
MYIARFSYDVLPVNRQRAIDCIRREVQAARRKQLNARLLVPLTRGERGPALQFEVELTNLDQLDQFRQSGVESSQDTATWMREFSEILLCPPEVAILRVDETRAA